MAPQIWGDTTVCRRLARGFSSSDRASETRIIIRNNGRPPRSDQLTRPSVPLPDPSSDSLLSNVQRSLTNALSTRARAPGTPRRAALPKDPLCFSVWHAPRHCAQKRRCQHQIASRRCSGVYGCVGARPRTGVSGPQTTATTNPDSRPVLGDAHFSYWLGGSWRPPDRGAWPLTDLVSNEPRLLVISEICGVVGSSANEIGSGFCLQSTRLFRAWTSSPTRPDDVRGLACGALITTRTTPGGQRLPPRGRTATAGDADGWHKMINHGAVSACDEPRHPPVADVWTGQQILISCHKMPAMTACAPPPVRCGKKTAQTTHVQLLLARLWTVAHPRVSCRWQSRIS